MAGSSGLLQIKTPEAEGDTHKRGDDNEKKIKMRSARGDEDEWRGGVLSGMVLKGYLQQAILTSTRLCSGDSCPPYPTERESTMSLGSSGPPIWRKQNETKTRDRHSCRWRMHGNQTVSQRGRFTCAPHRASESGKGRVALLDREAPLRVSVEDTLARREKALRHTNTHCGEAHSLQNGSPLGCGRRGRSGRVKACSSGLRDRRGRR